MTRTIRSNAVCSSSTSLHGRRHADAGVATSINSPRWGRGRCWPTASPRASCPGRTVDRGLPPGGAQPHRHQRARDQSRADPRPVPAGLDHRHRRDGRSTNSNGPVLHALESRQRTERYAAREPRRREQDQPEPSPRRAAHPARERRAHRDFETVRRNADSTRNTPRRTSQGTHRACRPRNPADQAASKRPASGTHRVFRDTDTRRASRAHRPKSRTPANRRRAYRPRKRAPPEKDRPPWNKRPESGVKWCTAPRSAPLCAGAAICRSGDFVLAALDLTADPITRTLAPRHTPTRGVTPATSTARRPRRG